MANETVVGRPARILAAGWNPARSNVRAAAAFGSSGEPEPAPPQPATASSTAASAALRPFLLDPIAGNNSPVRTALALAVLAVLSGCGAAPSPGPVGNVPADPR